MPFVPPRRLNVSVDPRLISFGVPVTVTVTVRTEDADSEAKVAGTVTIVNFPAGVPEFRSTRRTRHSRSLSRRARRSSPAKIRPEAPPPTGTSQRSCRSCSAEPVGGAHAHARSVVACGCGARFDGGQCSVHASARSGVTAIAAGSYHSLALFREARTGRRTRSLLASRSAGRASSTGTTDTTKTWDCNKPYWPNETSSIRPDTDSYFVRCYGCAFDSRRDDVNVVRCKINTG